MDENAVLLAIGRLEGKMDGIGREIGDLKTASLHQSACCRECRDDIDTEISNIKTYVDKAEGYKLGTGATIALIVAVIGGSYSVVQLLLFVVNLFPK